MHVPIDRRLFLRRSASASLLTTVLPLLGCDLSDRRTRGGGGAEGDGAEGGGADGGGQGGERQAAGADAGSLTRPILLPWSEEAVHLWAPPPERPMAYVSMASHRIFVEHESRDRVFWLLGAHISVSSGLWRIPLLGDDPRVPIVPDDRRREFEEQPMRAWDPAAPPAEGDLRIRWGTATPVRIAFACAPLSGGDAWLGAGPLEITRCGPGQEDACREDFMAVGAARRYADRACLEPTGTVRLLTWACAGS